MGETAKIAGNLWGDKLYQQRAREALPLLVRQAEAGTTVYYSELAEELGMPNARNLNYPLGAIGDALEELSEKWDEKVPVLQCLVVNKTTEVPGAGIGWFIEKQEQFRKLPRARQQRLLSAALMKVYSYPSWREVLVELGLPEPKPLDQVKLDKATRVRVGGESERHRLLKEYVAVHPEIADVGSNVGVDTEYELPSGDRVDVLFSSPTHWCAVEVKPKSSDESDLLRGLFQCVKYRAVIEAVQASRFMSPSARAILVLEGHFPKGLTGVRNVLGVEVIQGVQHD